MRKSVRFRLLKMASAAASNRIGCALLDSSVRTLQAILGIGTASAVDSGEETSIRTCGPDAVVFDVGANMGQFAHLVHTVLKPPYRLYCFEPSREAFLQLKQNASHATLSNIALGDVPGQRVLHSDRPGSGLASFTLRNLEHYGISFSCSETVEVDTLDRVCDAFGVSAIDLLKIDVEGHELDVLRGGSGLFNRHAIKAVQFEFGGCNIDTRTYFRDFFYFFKERGMMIHRITPSGHLLPIDRYREIDEQFRTTNFLAIRL
jgi:FkbM family methyltransferase